MVEAAVREILADTQDTFPVLFYAPFGFGKTHLAVGTYYVWLAGHPGKSGKLISASDFIMQWQTFFSTQTSSEFYLIYDSLDILVMEDLQEIAASEHVQEVLVDILDRLHRRGAKSLFTSTQPLGNLALIPRLASRLRGGVCIPIAQANIETRLAILSLDEHRKEVKFSPDALEALAEYSAETESTLYETLSVLRQLEAQRRLAHTATVTSADVREFFNSKANECSITIADIAKRVAKHCKIRLVDLRSKSRKASLVAARDMVYYLTRKMTRFTLDELGEYFGGRDHTSILHGCKQAEQRLSTDVAFRQTVDTLYAEIRPLINSPVRNS